MKLLTISPDAFAANRERLKALLLKNSVAVVNANDIMPGGGFGKSGGAHTQARFAVETGFIF